MTVTMTRSQTSSRRSEALPRWATLRTDRLTFGGEIAAVSRELGKPLMPWQRLVADVGGEYDLVDGRVVPAYREVIATVMRQSGKSTLNFAWTAHRSVMWPRLPQRSIYSAQDGKAARKKLFLDAAPMWERSATIGKLIERVYRGVGPFEGVNWRTGSTVHLIDSSESAGHGLTEIGLVVVDESFADVDDRREQATAPAMATQRDAQTLNTSTAGTDASTFLRRKIIAGRAAADAGSTSGLAYFEWSIPDDADIDDLETWWEFMPALGWTIDESVVAYNRSQMADNEFRRSFGNQWTSVDNRMIPLPVWLQVVDRAVAPQGSLTLAVEVHPDRSSACIVAFGGRVGELVELRDGVSWLVPRVVELARMWGASVRLDGGGPAGVLVPELEQVPGLSLEVFGARDVARACAGFFDGLVARRFKIRQHDALDAAAAAVVRRGGSEMWSWARRGGDVDVTPIMALSLAAAGVAAEFYPVRRLR